MFKKLMLLFGFVFFVFGQGYAKTAIDSFGVINTTPFKMSLESVTGTNGVYIDENCLLPSDIPTTSLEEHPDSTGCSGTIGASGGTVNYVVKIGKKSFFGRTHSGNYKIVLAWNADKKDDVTTFTCASTTCPIPTNDFTLSARYDSFDGYNVVIQQHSDNVRK